MATRSRRSLAAEPEAPNNTARNVLIVIGALVLLCGGSALGGFVFIRSQLGYDEAVERATANPRVQKLLGAPVSASFFFAGAARAKNDDGVARLEVALEGSKQGGTLIAAGVKTSGVWGFSKLDVVGDDGKRVSLVGE